MSEERIDVSFALPVFNVKPYIGACITSIRDQGLVRYEIVCVDDCSTDGSYDELLRLAALYPEMRVYRNGENKGVSHTRNRAVDEAAGDYVWFVDPDDLLVKGAAPLYLQIARERQAEAVFGRRLVFRDGGRIPDPQQVHPGCRQVDFARPRDYYFSHSDGIAAGGVWIGLFSRDLLNRHHIRFREDMSLLEDLTFHFEFGFRAANVIAADYDGYLYRVRRTSGMRANGKLRREEYIRCGRKMLGVLEAYLPGCPDRLTDAVNAHIQECKAAIVRNLSRLDDRQYAMRELKRLEADGVYPYRYRRALAFRCTNPRDMLKDRLMSHETGFRVLWRISHRGKKNGA